MLVYDTHDQMNLFAIILDSEEYRIKFEDISLGLVDVGAFERSMQIQTVNRERGR